MHHDVTQQQLPYNPPSWQWLVGLGMRTAMALLVQQRATSQQTRGGAAWGAEIFRGGPNPARGSRSWLVGASAAAGGTAGGGARPF